MTEWWETLDATCDMAWARIMDGVSNRDAPARHPVLATVGREGGAEARVVVLRGADRQAARLEFHTDAASAKVAELARDPQATLAVWDPLVSLQIRLRVRTTLLPADEAEWDAIPLAARTVYGGFPPPGTAMRFPSDWQPAPEKARFLRIVCDILEMETLHLGADRHWRARFSAKNAFAGNWIAP